jgi:hypothetical protein
MPAIQPRIAALLERWKAARAYPAMTYDGIVGDEAAYAKSRIVFLLKETPDPDFAELIAPGPEQGWGPDGGNYNFFRNLSSWKLLIEKWMSGEWAAKDRIDVAELQAAMERPFKNAGYVNIKKNAGSTLSGSWDSDWADIRRYAQQDSAFLREQLLLMDPRVIVCCGYNAGKGSVFECLRLMFPELQAATNDEGLYRFDGFNGHPLTVINWYHPQYTGSRWEELAKILCQ